MLPTKTWDIPVSCVSWFTGGYPTLVNAIRDYFELSPLILETKGSVNANAELMVGAL